jgi:hypothetical protein
MDMTFLPLFILNRVVGQIKPPVVIAVAATIQQANRVSIPEAPLTIREAHC